MVWMCVFKVKLIYILQGLFRWVIFSNKMGENIISKSQVIKMPFAVIPSHTCVFTVCRTVQQQLFTLLFSFVLLDAYSELFWVESINIKTFFSLTDDECKHKMSKAGRAWSLESKSHWHILEALSFINSKITWNFILLHPVLGDCPINTDSDKDCYDGLSQPHLTAWLLFQILMVNLVAWVLLSTDICGHWTMQKHPHKLTPNNKFTFSQIL